jgi:hypothetical protein
MKVHITVGKTTEVVTVPDDLMTGPPSPYNDIQQTMAVSSVAAAFVKAYAAERDRKKTAK